RPRSEVTFAITLKENPRQAAAADFLMLRGRYARLPGAPLLPAVPAQPVRIPRLGRSARRTWRQIAPSAAHPVTARLAVEWIVAKGVIRSPCKQCSVCTDVVSCQRRRGT